jgi:hypothetical protein
MVMSGQPLAPKGGNDRVYTPDDVALKVVQHFKPVGTCLEPCAGKRAFVRAMQGVEGTSVSSCEIDEGYDFFDWIPKVDWIVTNPPWSQFRAFQAKAMEVADNVVFVALFNAWWMKARVRDRDAAGFGVREALLLDTPAKPWPQTGFQLAAVHIQRGYLGDMKISYGNRD